MGIEGEIQPILQHPGSDSSYHLYGVQLQARQSEDNIAIARRRKEVYLKLKNKGIFTQIHYIPVFLQPDFHGKFWSAPGGFPGAERYYAGCLSLPLFPRMTRDDVQRVMRELKEALTGS